MTLRRKLLMTSVVLLLLVGVQGGTAFFLITQVVEESAELVGPALARVDMLAHLEADVLRLHALAHTQADASSTGEPRRQDEIDELRAAVQQLLQDYGGQQLDDSRRSMLATVEQQYADVLNDPTSVVAFEQLDSELHQLRHAEYRVTEATRELMVSQAAWARWPLGLVVLAVAAVELALGWHLSRGIMGSLALLRAGARRIAREQFDLPISRPQEAEFAEVAVSLNTVMLELKNNRAERVRAEADRAELMQGRLVQVVRAQEAERARISRELHDEASQTLTALKYGLDHLHQVNSSGATRRQVEHLQQLATAITASLGRLARDLRPSVLDDLGLLPALRSLVREYVDRYGTVVELHVHGTIPRLTPDAETALYRVVQEALTNIAKHASASHVDVTLDSRSEHVAVQVWDDGRGFDPRVARSGLGLAGIAERVQLLGGEFEVHSQPGAGSRIEVRVPVGGFVSSATKLVPG